MRLQLRLLTHNMLLLLPSFTIFTIQDYNAAAVQALTGRKCARLIPPVHSRRDSCSCQGTS
jgi:hypothetical protein